MIMINNIVEFDMKDLTGKGRVIAIKHVQTLPENDDYFYKIGQNIKDPMERLFKTRDKSPFGPSTHKYLIETSSGRTYTVPFSDVRLLELNIRKV